MKIKKSLLEDKKEAYKNKRFSLFLILFVVLDILIFQNHIINNIFIIIAFLLILIFLIILYFYYKGCIATIEELEEKGNQMRNEYEKTFQKE